MKMIDLTGQKFGQLKVVRRAENRYVNKSKGSIIKYPRIHWECLCDCGKITNACSHHLKAGKIISCGCYRKKILHDKNWKGCGDLSGQYLSAVRGGARDRNIEFNLDVKFLWELFIKQDSKCALTGLDICLAKSSVRNFPLYKEQTASLDRIDSSKGYTEENVWWVHKWVNIMKSDLSLDEFYNFCELVTEKRKNK